MLNWTGWYLTVTTLPVTLYCPVLMSNCLHTSFQWISVKNATGQDTCFNEYIDVNYLSMLG